MNKTTIQPAPEQVNYLVPFQAKTIFKSTPKPENTNPEYDEILARAQGEDNSPKEYSSIIAAEWADVAGMQSYPYEDDDIWDKFSKSPKFYLILRSISGPFLIEGDFNYWLACWSYYKLSTNATGR